MTVNRRWPSSVDESASVYSLDTESWQSVTHEHLYHDSPRPIFAEPRLTVGYQPIRYPDTSAGLSLDALAIADTLQMTNMYSLYQDQIYSRSVPALPQSTTNQISQSVHTYSNQSMPKAWSTTTDAPSDYQWIPDYDFQPDWSGSISQGQSERTIEDIKETGAVFHSRVWICRACGKEFPKKHALKYVILASHLVLYLSNLPQQAHTMPYQTSRLPYAWMWLPGLSEERSAKAYQYCPWSCKDTMPI